MIHVVQPRAERIRSLYLAFNNIYDVFCLLQSQDHEDTLPLHVWSFPNLKYLTLCLYFYPTERTVVTALQSMPKLHTVELSHVDELIIQLPWAQLTSLTIYLISESLFRVLLAQCPALETGRFSVRGKDSHEDLPIVNITLTQLTTLKVRFLGRSHPEIFDGIRFPSLDNLTLRLSYRADECYWTAPEFPQLAPISTLSLEGHIDTPDMINILRETKNVTTLKVEFEDGHGEVLKALTLGEEDEEVLLPKLGVLHVRMCSHHLCEPFAVVDFVGMVVSRSPSGAAPLDVAPLREVWVGVETRAYGANTLKADLDTVFEQWSHKTDMPLVRYENDVTY